MLPARRRAAIQAHAETARAAGLEAQVEQLTEAVTAHAEVDQAIGVVVAVGGLSPAEAWDVLREISMRSNVKLRLVALRLVAWPRTQELDPVIRAELQHQLDLRGAQTGSGAAPEPQ
ncbi:ANTAR domain-containing protein [Streptomyces sp. NPDC102360]|uniref:ANTAR domain-containing protein n=1 Tax=Streptomyces sp. NPDC102360 TaxID=3366160 RepID=UPI003811E066